MIEWIIELWDHVSAPVARAFNRPAIVVEFLSGQYRADKRDDLQTSLSFYLRLRVRNKAAVSTTVWVEFMTAHIAIYRRPLTIREFELFEQGTRTFQMAPTKMDIEAGKTREMTAVGRATAPDNRLEKLEDWPKEISIAAQVAETYGTTVKPRKGTVTLVAAQPPRTAPVRP
jgi:hypothetical protein